MDWSKAKTILIVAFIITNVLLGGLLLTKKLDITPTLSDDFIREVKKMLDEKNITVSTEIPKDEVGLVPLTVRYEILDVEFLDKILYDGKATIENTGVETNLYDENSRTNIRNGKTFKYERVILDGKSKSITQTDAIKLADNFINDLNFYREDMVLSYVENIDDKYYITYSKKYEGDYVERAYIDIVVSSIGVEKFERTWLDLKAKGDVEIFTNTAPKAILNLLSMNEVYGKEIIDISICYYFDPKQHDYIETLENAKEGKTVPAWRILFNDGTRVMIDSY